MTSAKIKRYRRRDPLKILARKIAINFACGIVAVVVTIIAIPEPHPGITVNYAKGSSRPAIYPISVSLASYPDGDYWLIEYAMDRHIETAQVPTTKDPQGYMDYFASIGDMVGGR